MQPDLERLLRESRSALPDPDPVARRRGIGLVLARIDPGRGRRRVGLFSAAIVALLAASLAVAAERIVQDAERTRAVTAFRIIDRTLVCRVSGIGYPESVRFVNVSASPYNPDFDVAPYIGVSEGAVGEPGWLTYLRTGPAGEQNQEPTGRATLPRTGRGPCVSTRLRVPLSSKGLTGGPIGEDPKRYECDVPAKVLVRVRAIFKRPTVFRVDPRFPDFQDAKGNIAVGYVAATSLRGRKPLAFASVQDEGNKASIFVARSRCTPDR